MSRRFILLDRDGTIIREKHYLSSPAEVELLSGAGLGLRRLQDAGYGLIVISNQSAVGRGYLTESTLQRIHVTVRNALQSYGVELDGIFHCPHMPEDNCLCRKPGTAMVLRAAAVFGFNPADAVMIGDKPCDIELGHRCGMKTILVRTGYGREYEAAGLGSDYVCDDLAAAASILVSRVQTEKLHDYQCC